MIINFNFKHKTNYSKTIRINYNDNLITYARCFVLKKLFFFFDGVLKKLFISTVWGKKTEAQSRIGHGSRPITINL